MNVVIGGASGIGAAVAAALPGATLVADLRGGDVPVDVRDVGSVRAVADRVDRLDALVVTAGVSPAQADARTVLDVDLAGTARVLAAFDRLVVGGTVAVCTASMAGHLGAPTPDVLEVLDDPLGPALVGLTDDPATAYVLAKLGVIRLVRRTAVAWGARGARLTSVSPGVVDTPMGAAELAAGSGAADVVAGSPLGRIGRPEEIAAVVAFLCSPGAAFVTGVDVLVDGGAVAALGDGR